MNESSASSSPAAPNRSEIFVVSVGGSLLFQQNAPDLEAIRRIAGAINTLSSEGYKFALVVGGGEVTRSFIHAGADLGASQFALDEIGIAVTKANALLFIQALPKAHSRVLTDIHEANALIEKGLIPVFGGLLPGFTTDTVAALLAERLNGTFVNLSDVDGVYSADPKEHKKAKLFREVSFEQLLDLTSALEAESGRHAIVDVTAAVVLKRSRIPSLFINGNNLENFESAVKGKPFNGTIVQTSEKEINQVEKTEKD